MFEHIENHWKITKDGVTIRLEESEAREFLTAMEAEELFATLAGTGIAVGEDLHGLLCTDEHGEYDWKKKREE